MLDIQNAWAKFVDIFSPVTLLELFDLDPESDAVWVCDSSWNPIIAMSAENACEWASDADTVLFFARKPTPADIEAARAEKSEGGQ